MNIFNSLEKELLALERTHFERLRRNFEWSPELAPCISGAVQFFSIDDTYRNGAELPVVCLVGVNYTQEKKRDTRELVHYSGATPPTVSNRTPTRRQPQFVIAAYNRNRLSWATMTASDPPSPLNVYGAERATQQSGLTGTAPEEVAPFILMMTNTSPFITQKAWQDQATNTLGACESLLRQLSAERALGRPVRSSR